MEKNENGYSAASDDRRGNAARQRDDIPECSELQLGMVYSPYQSFRMLMTPERGLKSGTLFEELYKPLMEVCNE